MKNLHKIFSTFADTECRGSSVLYEALSGRIAEDEELLRLAMQAREGQPVPNLLLSAVHYLLLQGAKHPLADYYESLTEKPSPSEDAFPSFKSFCREHETVLIQLLREKLVQTNEVNRCTYLYPSFCYIYSKAKKPLSLIEVGTSAGLQLLWDHYGYSYGTGEIYGNGEANLILRAALKGDRLPPLLSKCPPAVFKTGIDLHLNDVTKKEDKDWLRALIWPEHHERRAVFEKASAVFEQSPVPLIEGDAIRLLKKAAEQAPLDSALCIYHTHVANQLPQEKKVELLKTVSELGKDREVHHLYNNIQDRNLHLDSFANGKRTSETLAETDGHGRWFRWLV